MKNSELDLRINDIYSEIKKLIIIEYGDASPDELIKLSSFNKMNLTNRGKIRLLNHIIYIKQYLSIQEYINYILTLVQLISIDNKILDKSKHLDLIINIFNKMVVEDYQNNIDTFTNTKLLNHISKLNSINEITNYLVTNYKDSKDIEEMIQCIDGFGCRSENRRF